MSYYPHPSNVYQPIPPQSGMAVTGFVLSCVGGVFLFLGTGLVLCPLGIIFSGIGMYDTSNGQRRGRGMATAGLTIGIVGLLFSLLFLLLAARS